VARLILLEEPPSIDANEITDKGSINQRAVLTRRASEVEALHATSRPRAVIEPKAPSLVESRG
jgi:feruloyl-CoA synthase